MLLYFILCTSKVLVIDDVGLSKDTTSESTKKQLIKTIQAKISGNNEEVVIYNDKDNTRISSKDLDNKVDIDKPVIEQGKLLKSIEEYENDLKHLKDVLQNTDKPYLNDAINGISEGDPVSSKPYSDPLLYKNNSINDMQTNDRSFGYPLYNPQRWNSDIDSPTPKYSTYDRYIPDTSILTEHPSYETTETYPDKLKKYKLREQDTLKQAIESRKNYVRLRMQEISDAKAKLKHQMNQYRNKIEDLLKKINRLNSNKKNTMSKVIREQNHIKNLRLNTKQINDKKEQVMSFIRITQNEVQKYTNLLENENNKLNMLEKQNEVYDNTLKKYDSDIDKEADDIDKYKNEINKDDMNLKNLLDLYKDYYNKNRQIDEEMKKYDKMEGCLDAEGNNPRLQSVSF